MPKDHEFKVCRAQQNALAPLTAVEVVKAWERTHPAASKGPMVVIAAEGGGIEASAWANVVLSELEKVTKGRLHDSVVLFSSVSGGSTGAYYYLDQYKSQDGIPIFVDGQALTSSKASTLSSVMRAVNSHASAVLGDWTPSVEGLGLKGRNIRKLLVEAQAS
jgi:hypothetical protein